MNRLYKEDVFQYTERDSDKVQITVEPLPIQNGRIDSNSRKGVE